MVELGSEPEDNGPDKGSDCLLNMLLVVAGRGEGSAVVALSTTEAALRCFMAILFCFLQQQ